MHPCIISTWALGSTIGESLVFSQKGGYESPAFGTATPYVSMSMMGDTTLRMQTLVGPSDVVVTPVDSTHNSVGWVASPDASVLGYNVYRSTDGVTFTIANTSSLVPGTTFTDSVAAAGTYQYYMVRAVNIETSASGTYYKASEGAFSSPNPVAQGDWMGIHGAVAYDVIGGPSSIPVGVSLDVIGALIETWSSSTAETRGLQTSTTTRVAAALSSATSFTIDLSMTDALAHEVSLYAVDWNNSGLSETVQVKDSSDNLLYSLSLQDFASGRHLYLQLTGNVEITVTGNGSSAAVLSGLFID